MASRGGGADSDLRADWLSKSLAAACSERQPAKKRFLCTFTTVNGKFNQSYIEMVISCTGAHVHMRRSGARLCLCWRYITHTQFVQVRRVAVVFSQPDLLISSSHGVTKMKL